MIRQRFVDVWGEPGQGRRQFRFPFLLDISDEGYLVVVEPINTRVQVLNDQGKFVNFIGNWGTKPGQLFRPKGAAVWKDRVFVTDSYLGRIQIYDRIQPNWACFVYLRQRLFFDNKVSSSLSSFHGSRPR